MTDTKLTEERVAILRDKLQFWPAPTSGEWEGMPTSFKEMVEWLDDANDFLNREEWVDRHDRVFQAIRSLILSAPAPKVVSREDFDAACLKFSGHWAGTLDYVRQFGLAVLREFGIAVEGGGE